MGWGESHGVGMDASWGSSSGCRHEAGTEINEGACDGSMRDTGCTWQGSQVEENGFHLGHQKGFLQVVALKIGSDASQNDILWCFYGLRAAFACVVSFSSSLQFCEADSHSIL